MDGLLDHPHYSRPENIEGLDVPPVLLSGDHAIYSDFQTALQQRLDGKLLVSPAEQPDCQQNDLVMAVGAMAATKLAGTSAGCRSSLALVPRQVALAAHRNNPDLVAAIYLDQPAQRWLGLVRAALPEVRRVGLLVEEPEIFDRDDWQQAADHLELELQFATMPPDENPVAVLRQVIDWAEVFIALPGSPGFNRQTAGWVIKLGMRSRTPVLAYSTRYVTAG